MFLSVSGESDRITVRMHPYFYELAQLDVAKLGERSVADMQMQNFVAYLGDFLVTASQDSDENASKVVLPFPAGDPQVKRRDVGIKMFSKNEPGSAAMPLDVLLFVEDRLKPVAEELGKLSLIIVPDVALHSQVAGLTIDFAADETGLF